MVNAMNAEPLIQSRVAVGSSLGVIGSIGIVIVEVTQSRFPNYNWAVLGPALLVVWSAGYSLYGRVTGGLKPLFSGWFQGK